MLDIHKSCTNLALYLLPYQAADHLVVPDCSGVLFTHDTIPSRYMPFVSLIRRSFMENEQAEWLDAVLQITQP